MVTALSSLPTDRDYVQSLQVQGQVFHWRKIPNEVTFYALSRKERCLNVATTAISLPDMGRLDLDVNLILRSTCKGAMLSDKKKM